MGTNALPFTRDELREAFALVYSPEEAEQMADAFAHPSEDAIGFTIFDGTFHLLAAVSDALAARVVAAVPSLEEEVLRIRAAPEEYLARLRDYYSGS